MAAEGALLEDLSVVSEGFASFWRDGAALLDLAGPGAYWGDLSLVQGKRLCQSEVRACGQRILALHGPVPAVARPARARGAAGNLGPQAPGQGQGPGPGARPGAAGVPAAAHAPALVLLVVRAPVLARVLGPLIDLVRLKPAKKQAAVFSRIVC